MYTNTALLALLAIISEITTASPGPQPLKLDFSKESKRSDAKRLRARGYDSSGSVTVPLVNGLSGTQYWVNITVGTPGQNISVQLDTGSSDLWIPSADAPICKSKKMCVNGAFDSSRSSTYKLISNDFNMTYINPIDFDSGDYITDVVGMGSVQIPGMQMGLANKAYDQTGVMGVSFTSAENVCSNKGECNRIAPTVVDQLQLLGFTQRHAYSLWLNDLDSDQGSILFGGIDSAKYHGDLIALPIQPDPQTGQIDALAVTLSSVAIQLPSGELKQLSPANLSVAAILDSGTFDTQIPSDIANAIIGGMGSVTVDGSQFVPCRYANANASMVFGFGGPGGPSISVPLSEMVVDAGFQFEDNSPACYLGVDPVDVSLGSVILFGDTFLRSAYVVYDLENKEIAMAQTNFNTSDSNIKVIPSGTGLPGVSITASQAVVNQTASGSATAAVGNVGGAPTSATGKGVATGTPTFDLGAAISKTGGGASASATGKSGAGGMGADRMMGGVLVAAVVGAVAAM